MRYIKFAIVHYCAGEVKRFVEEESPTSNGLGNMQYYWMFVQVQHFTAQMLDCEARHRIFQEEEEEEEAGPYARLPCHCISAARPLH